jgi:hypothetical protein
MAANCLNEVEGRDGMSFCSQFFSLFHFFWNAKRNEKNFATKESLSSNSKRRIIFLSDSDALSALLKEIPASWKEIAAYPREISSFIEEMSMSSKEILSYLRETFIFTDAMTVLP